ncbi:glycosyltransferase [archaeon]|nr:glycosyltransferase [archaeon]
MKVLYKEEYMEFSIIIPACNEGKYIEKTLKSIPKNNEIIVVCNNCNDNTFKIAKKYSKVYEIIKGNVSVARNYGAKKAKYGNLIFLDADTIINKNNLKEIEKSLSKSLIGTCKGKYDDKKFIYSILAFFKNSTLKLFHNAFGITFCKKDIFTKTKGFNEQKSKKEISEFIIKAKKYGKYKIANTYVTTSARRFKKLGITKVLLYWIRENILQSKKEYPVIR